MFIQTQNTPNPDTLKFLPGEKVMDSGTFSANNKGDALVSPLAEAIFDVENVEGVFFGSDFVTVTKSQNVEWETIKPAILTAIMEYYVSEKPLFWEEQIDNEKDGSSAEEDDDIVVQIKELINTRVRPSVAEDGGDIVYHGFEGGVVFLEMHGSCSGCPSATITLKEGIENLLKHYIPEVEAVEAV